MRQVCQVRQVWVPGLEELFGQSLFLIVLFENLGPSVCLRIGTLKLLFAQFVFFGGRAVIDI